MKHFILIAATAATIPASAQDIYAPALAEIQKNSTHIQLYGKEFAASVAENKSGLSPADPEVEFGYLWGNNLTGNRKDISVKQEFDFPTVYSRRNRLAKQRDTEAAALFASQRAQTLLQAKELLIEAVYWNAMHALASAQLEYARKIMTLYESLMEHGEATAIDYNKAALSLAGFTNELTAIKVEQSRIASLLASLNGGNEVAFTESSFPAATLPDNFEQWLAQAELKSPHLRLLQSQIDVSTAGISLARADALPKLSVGYQGEYVAGANFSGLNVGVSIPLWQNRGKVRAAKAQAATKEEALQLAREEYLTSLKSLFTQAVSLNEMANRYRTALTDASNDALLYKALQKGQISMLEYVNEVQYSFTMHEKLLATLRDRELAIARLYASEL